MTNINFYPSAIDAGGCISNGWDLVKRNYGMYLGISLIAVILSGCIPCVSTFLIGPIMGGVFYVILRDMRGDHVDFGMMFKGFEKFVPLMVIGLIQSIPGVIFQILRFTIDLGQLGVKGGRGEDQFFQSTPEVALASGMMVIVIIVSLAMMIFSLIWWACFFFAIPLAMEHDLSPIDAIKLSARAAMSNIGGLILILILEALVVLLGIIMCVLGVFFISIPVMFAANAFVYRQVFPMLDQTFNMTPPPPGTYGGNFGMGQ